MWGVMTTLQFMGDGDIQNADGSKTKFWNWLKKIWKAGVWKRSYHTDPASCHTLCIQGAWGFGSPFWPGDSASQILLERILQLGLLSAGFTRSRARFHLLEKCPCMSHGCGWRKISVAHMDWLDQQMYVLVLIDFFIAKKLATLGLSISLLQLKERNFLVDVIVFLHGFPGQDPVSFLAFA